MHSPLYGEISPCPGTCRPAHLAWDYCIPYSIPQGSPLTFCRASSYFALDLNPGSVLHNLQSRFMPFRLYNQARKEIAGPPPPEIIHNLLNKFEEVIWVPCLSEGTTRNPWCGSA